MQLTMHLIDDRACLLVKLLSQ